MTCKRAAVTTGQHLLWSCLALACLVFSSPLSAQEPRLWRTLRGHTERVCCVAFSPDGKTLVSGSDDNTIRFWDVASGKEQAAKKAAVYGVDSVAFSPDGKTLATGCGGNTIKLWDMATRKSTTLLNKKSQFASPRVVFSPDGKTLASAGQCIRDIRLWNLATGKQTVTKGHDEYGVKALVFQCDGKTLITVGHDARIKWWDVATGKEKAMRLTVEWAPAAAFSPDASLLALVHHEVERVKDRNVVSDNSVKLIEVASGKERASLEAEDVTSLVFSPDGQTLATACADHTIRLWDVMTGKERVVLKGHTDKIQALTFSADGKLLASGGEDRTIKLWDVARMR